MIEEYRPFEPKIYAEHGLGEMFGIVTTEDLAGHKVDCLPRFQQVNSMRPRDATGTKIFGGVKFMYIKHECNPYTKCYYVTYKLLRDLITKTIL